jgi:peptidoglycan/xylan/chitin deacetylase (PgdA/CDA1 family)
MRAILTYHSIDPSGSPISVAPEVFRAHVRWLASGAVRVVPLSGLRETPSEDDAVAITFDDGFRNVLDHAVPLLLDSGLPATVFVVSRHVGATNAWGGVNDATVPTLPLLGWDELGALADRGFEIGAHTRRYPRLAHVAGEAIEDEIAGSADDIEGRLGRRPESFAYPYGSVSDPVVFAVRRGFRRACTTALRPLHSTDDDVLLPRLDMYYFRRHGRLESWGSPRFRRHLWFRSNARWIRQLVSSPGDVL